MTAAARVEAGKAQNRTAHLFEAYFDDTTVYITDAPRAIVWNGNTYVALGHFLGFSGVRESVQLRIEECTIELTHCDQAKTWVALVLNEEILDRRLVIYKVFLNDALNAVIDPVPLFDGRMDSHRIVEDESHGSVRIVARSHWADFERRPGRRTNDAVQQIYFPGDKFFEFCASTSKVFVWGRPPLPPPPKPPPPPTPEPSDNSGDDSGWGGQGDPVGGLDNTALGDGTIGGGGFGGDGTGSGQGGQGSGGASNDPGGSSNDGAGGEGAN